MSKEARPSPAVSPQIAEKLRELAALVAEEHYGEGGRPPLETTFDEIETIGHQTGQLLAGVIDQQLTGNHREHFSQSQPCPQCGKVCPPAERERELNTLDGPVELSETACHCDDCRRDFFPSTASSSSR